MSKTNWALVQYRTNKDEPTRLGVARGRTLRRSPAEVAAGPWVEVERGLRSTVDRIFDVFHAPAAHRYGQTGPNFGPVAVVMDGGAA